MALILASQSPRRRELLHNITDDFSVKVSDADETLSPDMSPEEAVVYLATVKGKAVFSENKSDTVISADTVVVLDGKILGKPHSKAEAYEMLSSLSGRSHFVYTGVCVLFGDKSVVFYEKTDVTFRSLSPDEINSYIESGEPFDKAGGYGIQGKGSIMITSINGDYYNVMGLPVAKLYEVLKNNSLI